MKKTMFSDELDLAKQGAIAKAGSGMGAFWLSLGSQDLLALEGLIEEMGVEALGQARDPKSGKAPVEWAAFLHRHDALAALLAHGFDKELAAGGRPAPLIQAVESHCLECLALLVQAGAALEVEDSRGRTPLVAAAQLKIAKHSARMVEALLAAGADPDRLSSSGFFALGAAASGDRPVDIDKLLEAGADVDRHAGDRFTALFYAVDNGACAAAEALLRAGADHLGKVEGVEGFSEAVAPLDVARGAGDSAMAALLYSFAEAAALRERLVKIAPGALRPARSKARL